MNAHVEWISEEPGTVGKIEWLGLINPTNQVWNTPTYQRCMGQRIQQCSAQYSGQQLTDCIDAMQLECIAIALNELQSTPSSSYPWGTYSTATRDLQVRINTELAALGYRAIGVDGVLGAQTCGALRFLQQETGGPWMDLYGNNCQAFTDPVPIGGVAPAPPPPPPPPTCEPGQRVDTTTNTCVDITCPAGQRINLQTNVCEPIPVSKAGAGWGLFLLAAAAAGAIAIAATRMTGGEGAAA